MSEELMITKDDLVNWLNRPPSNDDLDLIGFITTRLENFYKLEQENQQLKETLKDIEELLLSEEQPVQPCNIRYDILEIIKKALGDKE